MVDTPGRCRELDYCSIGQMRTLVMVPLGKPFVCPECGKPLTAPPVPRPPGDGRKQAAIWGGAALATAGLLAVGLERPAPHHRIMLPPTPDLQPPALQIPAVQVLASERAAPAMVIQVDAITEALPILQLDPMPAAPLPPPATETLAEAQLTRAATTQAAALSPAPALQAAATLPPPLQQTLATAEITSTPVTRAAGIIGTLPPLHVAETEPPPERLLGTTQFAPAPAIQAAGLTASLPTLTVEAPAPIPVQTLAAGLASPAATLAQVTPIAAALPTLTVADPSLPPPPHAKRLPLNRPFSPVAIAGGTPPYPTDYIHDGRTGEVAMICTIETDGQPTGCRVHDIEGGRRFAEAAVAWLNSNKVQFAAILRNGQPVVHEEHWTVSVRPPR